ncbi:unnamed protein product, partial [marine sediment metagenome]
MYHYKKGVQFVKKGREKEAIEQFRIAIQKDETLKEAYFDLGEIFMRNELYDESERIFKVLVEL